MVYPAGNFNSCLSRDCASLTKLPISRPRALRNTMERNIAFSLDIIGGPSRNRMSAIVPRVTYCVDRIGFVSKMECSRLGSGIGVRGSGVGLEAFIPPIDVEDG